MMRDIRGLQGRWKSGLKMWRNCGEIKRKLRYNERKRKGSGCEADIYFSCAINERTAMRSRTKHNADKRGFISVMFICYHTYFLFIIFFFLIKRNRCSKLPVFFFHSCIMLSSCINVFMTKDITYKSYVTCVLI